MDDPHDPPISPTESGPSFPIQPETLPNEDVEYDTSDIKPQRRGTMSSVGDSTTAGSDTCRICRSEATLDEPLFYPCKCSGSIKFVHQECLMEWLAHSQKKFCELCKTPFRFTKLYDAGMPQVLPWDVFLQRACIHTIFSILGACRAVVVGSVWLAVLPWLIRWAWRWMFWISDAGWARDNFFRTLTSISRVLNAANRTGIKTKMSAESQRLLMGSGNMFNETIEEPLVLNFLKQMFNITSAGNLSSLIAAHDDDPDNSMPTSGPPADASLLSSWTYISEITSNPGINRMILDVFEGQLITCVVITGFILVFLIREWVVQQQPLVNIDNNNNADLEETAQQLRETARAIQEEEERIRRNRELIGRSREALVQLQSAIDTRDVAVEKLLSSENPDFHFEGWDEILDLLDPTDEQVDRFNDDREAEKEHYIWVAMGVVAQMKSTQNGEISLEDFGVKIRDKIRALPPQEQKKWNAAFVFAIKLVVRNKYRAMQYHDHGLVRSSSRNTGSSSSWSDVSEPAESPKRPPMPSRDLSSLAPRIRRAMEETADNMFTSSEMAFIEALAPIDSDEKWPRKSTPSGERVHAQEPELPTFSPSPPRQPSQISEAKKQTRTSDDVPITNAGPEAKRNIQLIGSPKAVPEPTPKMFLSEAELLRKLEQDAALAALETEIKAEDDAENETSGGTGSSEGNESSRHDHDEPPADESDSPDDNLENNVGSLILEDLGLEEVREIENLRQRDLGSDNGNTPTDSHPQRIAQAARRNKLQRLADWFWGDIPLNRGVAEQAQAPNEERLEDNNAAPFAPVQDDLPNGAAQQNAAEAARPARDPEVLAAAAEAGLDAEAAEDAEDLEGVLELIGFQGPLIGAIQTSTFCVVLVVGTLACAIGAPYLWGKLVLSFVASPMYFLIKMPLQVASCIADFIIDITMVIFGWAVFAFAMLYDFFFSKTDKLLPTIGGVSPGEWMAKFAVDVASSSATRLQNVAFDGLAVNQAFLRFSINSHASLREIGGEVGAVLHFTGSVITAVVDTLSSGSASLVWKRSLSALATLPQIPAKLLAGVEVLERYIKPLVQSLGGLRSGALTFQTSEEFIDPSLVYWSFSDRAMAVITGYVALAGVAAVYVAMDTPITRSESGQRTEKAVRDTLRQAGGVLKVILIISIEMLAFPLYCGLLLDVAFMPLFNGSSLATRWAFATESPYTFCFVHWFVGTCYMFHFALFVGMCRKILRKGLLWFIRDPDDPTFHPVRDVLERSVVTQLRKIAFSALVYGALVILCLGGVIWTIGHVFEGIFPIHWVSTEPILEFPMDLLLYNAVTPIMIRLFKPSDAVNLVYAWWLRRCARALRLSHFLFDDRRKDEEGHHVRKSWMSVLLRRKANIDETPGAHENPPSATDGEAPEAYFLRDGKYVLTPCNDQYRPPKAGEAFLHFDTDGVYIADKAGKKNDYFAEAYVPPLFRVRITLFMACLWIFSAFIGLCVTLVPLVLGRQLFASMVPADIRVNDIYAYSVGAYLLGGFSYGVGRVRQAVQRSRQSPDKKMSINLMMWLKRIGTVVLRAGKCFYVYGFIGVFLPAVLALAMHFYIILPIRTYIASIAAVAAQVASQNNTTLTANTTLAENATATAATFLQNTLDPERQPVLSQHTIHLLQDYCLGLLYVRIASRMIMQPATSRAAEAFRRITADGYLNPNARLATRYLVAPAILLSSVVLFFPPIIAKMFFGMMSIVNPAERIVDATVRTTLYRYSYPLLASWTIIVLCIVGIMKATARWRTMIRDEVYLVGEKLHNFGEKKPPEGSRTMRRRSRVSFGGVHVIDD